MSIRVPLLVNRKAAGFGPSVPVTREFTKIGVTGMATGDRLQVYGHGFQTDMELVHVTEGSGVMELDRPLSGYDYVRAEKVGTNSESVNVWLE